MKAENTEQQDHSAPKSGSPSQSNGRPNNQPSSDTISRLQVGGREFILVGTAHISKASVEEVREVIQREEPDRVCIEIDETRYNSLIKKQHWQNLNIGQVLRERKGFLLLVREIDRRDIPEKRIAEDLLRRFGYDE